MPLSAGDKLGPYEIVAPLGAGGMGEVYRARDTTLKRDVALKVLPTAFVRDHERMARFQREAEVLASLDHPNIGPIYGLVDSEDSRTLVLALIEGPTLADRISAEAMPPEEALHVAKQIIDALEYAHDRGVIHRDLKPANIKITSEGAVKVLDFGLAKVLEDEPPKSSLTNSPTLTLGHTRAGVILGTAAYMSPEQAVGRPVDRRSDIFSFGAVLYEMLTGKRAFGGATTPDVLEAVVKSDPDWSALPEGMPAHVRRLLERCLAKDRKQRLQSIGEARIALANPPRDEPTMSATPSRSWLSWVLFAATALALAALAFVHFREQPPVAELTRFQIPLPGNQSFANPLAPQVVSPDGRMLAFAAVGTDGKPHLWIRPFDSLDARQLPGVELGLSEAFFWSADSRFLAFQSTDNKLKKVDVSGGPPQTICNVGSMDGGSWSRDGVILFGGSVIMRVTEGGTPIALTALDPARQEFGHASPRLLPDGRHFLYFRYSMTPGNSGIYVGSIDAKPSEQDSKPLLVNQSFPEYYVPSGDSNTGYLLFVRDGTIFAQVFHPSTLKLSGDPIPVAEQVSNFQGFFSSFSASTNGVLVYVGGSDSSTGNVQLTWFDRAGKNVGKVGEPGVFADVTLCKDRKQAVVSRVGSTSGGLRANLWLLDLTRGGVATPFTSGDYVDESSVCSQDSLTIVFESVRDGTHYLYRKPTSGIEDEKFLLKSAEPIIPSSLSHDGRYLLYTVASKKAHVWILTMDESHKTMPFQVSESDELNAKFSPDGRSIVYQSDETGRSEIFVREFLVGPDGKPEVTPKHRISIDGGVSPYWRDDGAVIYGSLDRRTGMLAEIIFKPEFQVTSLKSLGQLPLGVDPVDVTTDGKLVLAAVPVGQSGPQQFTVVQNWQTALKK